MTLFDLHPEDLLEREARGALTPGEADRLRVHLEACAVCRFERLTRQDIGVEVERAEEMDVQRLLAAVLTPDVRFAAGGSVDASGIAAPSAVGPGTPPTPASGRARVRRSRVLLLVAALVTVAGVAGAAGWTGLRTRIAARVHGAATPPEVQRRAAPLGPLAPASRAAAGALASSEPVAEAPAPAPAGRVEAAAGANLARPTRAGGHAIVGTAAIEPLQAPANAVGAGTEVPAPVHGAATDAASLATAAALFDRANEARRAGDRAGAIQDYRTLLAQYPASPEARQGLAVVGKMLLDGGDGSSALRCFDEYLQSGGPMRQDVLAYRALALQRLGRPGDEAAAWSTLLASYPASVHAERARRRLADLGKP